MHKAPTDDRRWVIRNTPSDKLDIVLEKLESLTLEVAELRKELLAVKQPKATPASSSSRLYGQGEVQLSLIEILKLGPQRQNEVVRKLVISGKSPQGAYTAIRVLKSRGVISSTLNDKSQRVLELSRDYNP